MTLAVYLTRRRRPLKGQADRSRHHRSGRISTTCAALANPLDCSTSEPGRVRNRTYRRELQRSVGPAARTPGRDQRAPRRGRGSDMPLWAARRTGRRRHCAPPVSPTSTSSTAASPPPGRDKASRSTGHPTLGPRERQVRLAALLTCPEQCAGQHRGPQTQMAGRAVGAGLTFAALTNTCAMGAALGCCPG